MKIIEDNCHLLTFSDIIKECVSVKIGSSTTTNSVEKMLLGVVLDSNLTIEQHVSNLYR